MHSQRSETRSLDVASEIEHAVMTVLLGSDHGPWSRSELEREVGGPSGEPGDVSDALDSLYGSGLVHISGELVTLTRAARRMDQLCG